MYLFFLSAWGLALGVAALPRNIFRLTAVVRSLYGLRQASRTWHFHLVRGMMRLGMVQCRVDPCVLRLMQNGFVVLLALVHMDDVLCVGPRACAVCAGFG